MEPLGSRGSLIIVRAFVVLLFCGITLASCNSSSAAKPGLVPNAMVQRGPGRCSPALFRFDAPQDAVLARSNPSGIVVCHMSATGRTRSVVVPSGEVRQVAAVLGDFPPQGRAVDCPGHSEPSPTFGLILEYEQPASAHVFVWFGPGCGEITSPDGHRFEDGEEGAILSRVLR
jgi:hypothetical protein